LPWVQPDRPEPGFLDGEHFPAEKATLGAFIGDVLDLRHTEVPPISRAKALAGRTADPAPGDCGGHPGTPGHAEVEVAGRSKRNSRFAGKPQKPSSSFFLFPSSFFVEGIDGLQADTGAIPVGKAVVYSTQGKITLQEYRKGEKGSRKIGPDNYSYRTIHTFQSVL
jgi:hypothetical protein